MQYKRGDLVQIAKLPFSQHAGDIVLILEAHEDTQSYDFTIPERRGSVPEKLIARLLAHGLPIPEPWPSANEVTK